MIIRNRQAGTVHSGQRQGHDETDGGRATSEAAPPEEVPVADTTPEEAARKSEDSEDEAKSAGPAAAEAVSVIDSLAPMRAAGDILQKRRARLDSLDEGEEGGEEGEQSTAERDSAFPRAGEHVQGEEGASVPEEGVVVDVAVELKADEEPNSNNNEEEEEAEEVPVEQLTPSETGPQPKEARQPTAAAVSRADEEEAEAEAEAEEVAADPPPNELRKSTEGRERMKKGTAMAPSNH
jgi:hypothetical protein